MSLSSCSSLTFRRGLSRGSNSRSMISLVSSSLQVPSRRPLVTVPTLIPKSTTKAIVSQQFPFRHCLFSSDSSSSGSGKSENAKEEDLDKQKMKTKPTLDNDVDLFGVLDEVENIHLNDDVDQDPSATRRLGPPSRWPPQYQRDKTTGRLSLQAPNVVKSELSDRDRFVLNADPMERDQITLEHVQRHFQTKNKKKGEVQEEDQDEEDFIDEWGKRIRETDMSLNVLGRSVVAQHAQETLEDGTTLGGGGGRDDDDNATGFSTPFLTQKEFQAFQKYLKQTQHIANITKDDLPVQENGDGDNNNKKQQQQKKIHHDDDEEDDDDNVILDADDAQLSLQWLTQRAQRQMDDLALDDNPYSDIMPGDLTPVRLVNRKRAKAIPRQLLHHNNVDLLKYFLTPTGQIQNRVKTRLGARDQRKIAKLIKRARAMGLMPHVGQFKVEQHGWIHDKDMQQDLEWEKELEQRGLVISTRRKKDN